MKSCQKDAIICASYNKKLTAFQQKYLEYQRSTGIVKSGIGGNDEIYTLSQSVNTLRSLEKELEGILPKMKNNQ